MSAAVQTANPADETPAEEIGSGEQGTGDRAHVDASAAGATTSPDSTDPESPADQTVDDTVDGSGEAAAVTGGGSGEDEWYSVVWVPPGSLIIGPNARAENATPDKDRVRDIKKRGVRAPILAYRAGGDLVVTMGQIRTLAAIEAGVEEVPVWVQPPPVDDEKAATVDRIIDQLGENDHRTAMTRGDVYEAHKQLSLMGLSATAIARRRSRPKRVIEDSLRVGDSELASKAGDKYDLTMEQLAVIAEFEGYGDLETAKKLILTAVEHPNNFGVLAQRKRDDRAEAERLRQAEAALTEQLTAEGVTIFDESLPKWSGDARSLDRLRPSPDDEPGTELTAEQHASCPGHGTWIVDDYNDNDDRVLVAEYGCSDFRAHGHAQIHAPAGQAAYGTGTAASFDTVTSTSQDAHDAESAAAVEREKARIQRRWVIENNKNWDAAEKVRQTWLADFTRRSKAPKDARKWLALQKLAGPHELRKAMERGPKLAHRLLNLPEPHGRETGELFDKITNASEAKATIYDLYLTLVAMEEGLQRDSWRHPMGTDSLYMAKLIELGYPAHDVERKVITPEKIADVVAAQLDDAATAHHETETEDATDDGTDDGNVSSARPVRDESHPDQTADAEDPFARSVDNASDSTENQTVRDTVDHAGGTVEDAVTDLDDVDLAA